MSQLHTASSFPSFWWLYHLRDTKPGRLTENQQKASKVKQVHTRWWKTEMSMSQPDFHSKLGKRKSPACREDSTLIPIIWHLPVVWMPFQGLTNTIMSFPGGSDGKESACNAGDLGSIPGLRRSPGGGNGYPLQYSGLENSMDRGAWRAAVHGVTKSWTQLSNFHFQSTNNKVYFLCNVFLQT